MFIIRSLTHRRRLGPGIGAMGTKAQGQMQSDAGTEAKNWDPRFLPPGNLLAFYMILGEFWCILRVTYNHTYEFLVINYLHARTQLLGSFPAVPLCLLQCLQPLQF